MPRTNGDANSRLWALRWVITAPVKYITTPTPAAMPSGANHTPMMSPAAPAISNAASSGNNGSGTPSPPMPSNDPRVLGEFEGTRHHETYRQENGDHEVGTEHCVFAPKLRLDVEPAHSGPARRGGSGANLKRQKSEERRWNRWSLVQHGFNLGLDIDPVVRDVGPGFGH